MGNYSIPAKFLFSNILDVDIIEIPRITNKTMELGVLHSPEFICTPFKYTIGTLIESLEAGADVVMQFGGGCRYGYYSELQEEILKNLNYDFTYINFITGGKTDFKKIYYEIKKIDPNFSVIKSIYYGLIAIKMVKYMDLVDNYIRENIGFVDDSYEMVKLNQEMLKKFLKVKSQLGLYLVYKKYFQKIKNLKVKRNNKHLKVAVIGELYTIMEPFANYELEMLLANYGISVKRYTNVYYLLFQKKHAIKKHMNYAKEFVKYKMGADASDNIARTKYLCENNYDGIIHVKSTFCTPEIGAMPIINKICQQYNVPLLFFSFDANTSEVGFQTRIEAFYDMIERKQKHDQLLSRG